MGGIVHSGPEHFRPIPEREVPPQILGRFFYDKTRYGSRPDLIPKEETHKDLETGLGHILVTCDYGGPHSKYDDENQDSFVCGNTKNGDIFIAVIDGAGGSGGGLEASIKSNSDLANNLVQGLSPLEGLRSASGLLIDINEQKKRRAFASGRSFDFSHEGIYATAVAAKIEKSGRVLLAASGDSKIATIRNGAILREGTTCMQNTPSKLIEYSLLNPREYYQHPLKSNITGGLGIKDAEEPLGQEFWGQDKDRIVLASDGLWDLVSEYEVARLSNQCKTANEFQAALFKMAYDRNNADSAYNIEHAPGVLIAMPSYKKGGDNITIAVMELDFSSKEQVYLGFDGNPIVTMVYRIGNTLIRIEEATEKVGKDQIKISELDADGSSIVAKYVLDRELWNQLAQIGFSRAQALDFEYIRRLSAQDRQSIKDLLALDSQKTESPEKTKELLPCGETYFITTPGKKGPIRFSIHLLEITDQKVVFIDPLNPTQKQEHPRSWWNTIIQNSETTIEKLQAPEPHPGDSYHFRGFQKDGTPYDFHLTVQSIKGDTLFCVGKAGNVFERPRQFWNALFTSPGAQATKIS